MAEQEKLFVVVDPNDDEHVALERALITASQREVKPKIRVFIAVDHEAVDTRADNDNLFRDTAWFDEKVRGPLEAAGVEADAELSWSSEWQWAIQRSASHFGADTIYLPVHKPSNARRFTFSDSKWDLLKTADCPVLLVRPGAKPERKVVLAAVNFQADRENQRELNDRVLERGRLVAERNNADFHVVNAYVDSMLYPDRGKLANETGLPAEKIHVRSGYTDEVVAEVAKDIEADIVIIGTLGQTGKRRTRRGNTASRVIAGLNSDVMVFNHTIVR
ncbi:universal stress protein UspE [Maricurvus nonylphenolicus]|uniref:universal stress protein n=1 Tax=Maricurvus nonylphenolicus TaxID=1008307 RepID=UPI0036F2F390